MAKPDKSALMSPVASAFAEIEAAKAAIQDLEVAAAPAIADLVKNYGPGPHKMALPGGKTMIATFRKAGKTFHVNAIDASDIT